MNDWEYPVSCPLCGADTRASTAVYMHGAPVAQTEMGGLTVPVSLSVSYMRCLHCGIIYQSPKLTDEARERFYAGGMYQSIIKDNGYKTEIARAERVVEIIKQLDVESVLDIGCGHGELLQACQETGMLAVGVDIINYAMEGIEVIKPGEVRGKYDVVTMLHYLEHIWDPIAELRQALEYADKYVIVEVPRVDPADYTKRYLNIQHTLIFEPWVLAWAMRTAGMRIHGSVISNTFTLVVGERNDHQAA